MMHLMKLIYLMAILILWYELKFSCAGDLWLILESNFQRNYSAQCAPNLSTKTNR